jgi:UDP-N-acetylglucosamine 2-epimerase (non-hydrolysing)
MKLIIVGGARPNFMKIAPLVHELRRDSRGFEWKVVHTGQHYDYEMSKVFFDELDIGEPDYFLGCGEGSQAVQTARIMIEFEKVFMAEKPDITVVVGDVNSTVACSIVAKKLGGQVAHIEAGLRSGDITMPEEVNRILTDAIADYLFVTESDAIVNLKKEGKSEATIHFVGNVMIDTLLYGLNKLEKNGIKSPAEGKYVVATLHRPANVDDEKKLGELLGFLGKVSEDMKVYFPIHPRTRKNMERFGLMGALAGKNIELMPPLSYLNFLALWRKAAAVLTDSGGIQEETTYLGVPCLTLRDNTERPITVSEGTNVIAGTEIRGITKAYEKLKNNTARPKKKPPELWDGKSTERIINILKKGK